MFFKDHTASSQYVLMMIVSDRDFSDVSNARKKHLDWSWNAAFQLSQQFHGLHPRNLQLRWFRTRCAVRRGACRRSGSAGKSESQHLGARRIKGFVHDGLRRCGPRGPRPAGQQVAGLAFLKMNSTQASSGEGPSNDPPPRRKESLGGEPLCLPCPCRRCRTRWRRIQRQGNRQARLAPCRRQATSWHCRGSCVW